MMSFIGRVGYASAANAGNEAAAANGKRIEAVAKRLFIIAVSAFFVPVRAMVKSADNKEKIIILMDRFENRMLAWR
ncbi:hypothetical protein [Variovorax boronicumulans]|uniref:hypothetical protein n=1 Tax=Variovorax boronicumulans TaxID=436515 RepID=UPI003395230D